MLRMYNAKQNSGLSDEETEDSVYNDHAIRSFLGVDLAREDSPDTATLLKFRRLLETQELTDKIFEEIKVYLNTESPIGARGRNRLCHSDYFSTKKPGSKLATSDTSDEEGQPALFRDEGAHRHRCRVGLGACRGTAANMSYINQAYVIQHGQKAEVFGDS